MLISRALASKALATGTRAARAPAAVASRCCHHSVIRQRAEGHASCAAAVDWGVLFLCRVRAGSVLSISGGVGAGACAGSNSRLELIERPRALSFLSYSLCLSSSRPLACALRRIEAAGGAGYETAGRGSTPNGGSHSRPLPSARAGVRRCRFSRERRRPCVRRLPPWRRARSGLPDVAIAAPHTPRGPSLSRARECAPRGLRGPPKASTLLSDAPGWLNDEIARARGALAGSASPGVRAVARVLASASSSSFRAVRSEFVLGATAGGGAADLETCQAAGMPSAPSDRAARGHTRGARAFGHLNAFGLRGTLLARLRLMPIAPARIDDDAL